MLKVTMLFGEPAVGKTSIVREVIKYLGPSAGEVKSNIGLDGRHFNFARGLAYPKHNVIVMGLYSGEKNDGTDRLGLNTSPPMLNLLDRLQKYPPLSDWNVLIEGDRCANATFIDTAASLVDLRLFNVWTDTDELVRRHRSRNDTQTTVWLNGRATKVRNLVEKYRCTPIRNSLPEDLQEARVTVLCSLGVTRSNQIDNPLALSNL
jgi:hypothetical protein